MFDPFMRNIKIFNVILYTRLSKEEQGKSKEEQSKSIKNQLEICRKFIEEEQKNYPDCHFQIVAELKDDGVSGTTFERDDFKELIRLIENGKANMVITKDLSRLGRDHIKTDDYIEKWFPEHHVRYVSIMESVDTYTDAVSNDIAPIINWSNDHFAKQTSKKIKKQFDILRKEGKWTGGEPPLGYQRDQQKKYQLTIEPKGAEIVRKIFSLALENNSLDRIATILTDEKIPIPTIIKGSKRRLNKDILGIWSPNTIKEILQNEMYMGHMIQGKTTRLNHKSKTIVYLPKEQWIKVENTHEPIIDKTTFDTVQLLLRRNRNKTIKSYDYLLKGMLRCRECNHRIGIQHYKDREKNYTVCNYYRKYGKKKGVCTSHRFIYEEIEKAVLNSIKKECFSYVNADILAERWQKKEQRNSLYEDLKKKIDKSQLEVSRLQKQMDDIYEDKLKGIIQENQYMRFIKNKEEALAVEMKMKEKWERQLLEMRQKKQVQKDYYKEVQKLLSLKKEHKKIITQFIDDIYISDDGKIDIYFSFQNPHT